MLEERNQLVILAVTVADDVKAHLSLPVSMAPIAQLTTDPHYMLQRVIPSSPLKHCLTHRIVTVLLPALARRCALADRILVLYGSYRSDRMGIGSPILSWQECSHGASPPSSSMRKPSASPCLTRMYKEYPRGSAPPAMEAMAGKIRAADAFIFVVGEYNWGMQPGLKNLHRPLSRGMVLASRRDRQLLGRPTYRASGPAPCGTERFPRWVWW